MQNELSALSITRKFGDESFKSNGEPVGQNVLGFWQWACSDLVSNTMRGILAEFIVASALGMTSEIRREWDQYDLVTKEGVKLEVKSAAYLQSWPQTKLSSISFNIAPKKSWNPVTNEYGTEVKRQADVYVFCLLHHQDKSTLDPLELDQWTFYLLPTSILNAKKPGQKTITLSALMKLNPVKVSFSGIASSIKNFIPSLQKQ